MTAPRVGETFHLDLDGTAIAGRYIEVDPPHRMLLRWDRQGTDTPTLTPTFIEITLTPTGDDTHVKVQFSGLSAEDAAFYPQLWARHRPDRSCLRERRTERGATQSGTAYSEVAARPGAHSMCAAGDHVSFVVRTWRGVGRSLSAPGPSRRSTQRRPEHPWIG